MTERQAPEPLDDSDDRSMQEIVREMLEPNERSRERVLQAVARLREIADARERQHR